MVTDYEHSAQPAFEKFLRLEFLKRCKKNRSYSLRSFARQLETDPSTLSKIIHQKVSPGQKLIRRIGGKLGLSESDIEHYCESKKSSIGKPYRQIADDIFAVISDWYHYAIIELIKIDGFENSPTWIANALDITEEQASEALDRLKSLEILVEGENGELFHPNSDFFTSYTMDDPHKAVRSHQLQILQKAMSSIDEYRPSLRSQSSITVAVNREQIPEAQAMINRFRRKMDRFLSKASHFDDVYHLGISLYPVTQLKKETSP